VNLYYLDSSALVKRYYREDGTEFIQRLFDVGSLFVTSSIDPEETEGNPS